MAKIMATRNSEMSEREKINMERSRKIGTQGMVLLENDGTLPIKDSVKSIALFGTGARRTIKGGTGSGDVNTRTVVNIEQGLEAADFKLTTTSLLDRLDKKVEDARAAYFKRIQDNSKPGDMSALFEIFNNPFVEPSMDVVTDEEIASTKADLAIYVISRNSGEGKDRSPVDGDYELNDEEKTSITNLTKVYSDLVVLLNVGGVIDTKFLRAQKGIGSILLMSQAGNVGGHSVTDVLTGKATPSGHLTTTWAENYKDYPSADTFSHINGDINDEYYEDGIYIGYRYFDSFNVTPAYAFGYGKTYASFTLATESVSVDKKEVTVKVKVTNTSDKYTGKEVVQVYYSAPDKNEIKPYQELVGYAKTKELAPSESEVVTVKFCAGSMASYDTARASYVLDAGDYLVRVGTHSRNTNVVAKLTLANEVVTRVLANKLTLDCDLKEISRKGKAHYTYSTESTEISSATSVVLNPADFTTKTVTYTEVNPIIPANTSATKIKLTDVIAGKNTLDELVAQLTAEEMADLCVGTARGGIGGDSIVGAASAAAPGAAGDTSSNLIGDRDVRNLVLADGPAGLRLSRYFKTTANGDVIPGTAEAPLPGLDLLTGSVKPEIPEGAIDYYQYCTAIPIATLLAQTWDYEIIKEAGKIVGEEMIELGIHLWLAPGMNIHRNPLCGRNFEYYSEDPLVTGLCAAAETDGVQSFKGIGTTIKHFAFNNQEDNRMHTNAHVSERAAREIYLRGFEIAIKKSQPLSIMTSYNLINGRHTANSKDLLTYIARDEWGFEGIVMTDWGTTGSIEMNPGMTFKYGCSSAAGCVKAGNELTMPGSQPDIDDILNALDNPNHEYTLTIGDLQTCTKRILTVVMNSSAY